MSAFTVACVAFAAIYLLVLAAVGNGIMRSDLKVANAYLWPLAVVYLPVKYLWRCAFWIYTGLRVFLYEIPKDIGYKKGWIK